MRRSLKYGAKRGDEETCLYGNAPCPYPTRLSASAHRERWASQNLNRRHPSCDPVSSLFVHPQWLCWDCWPSLQVTLRSPLPTSSTQVETSSPSMSFNHLPRRWRSGAERLRQWVTATRSLS